MTKKIKVALVSPSSEKVQISSMENLALAYLAASLRSKNFEVDIIDAGMYLYNNDYIVDRILNNNIKLLAISLSSAYFIKSAKELINKIRDAEIDCHITIGGYLPTSYPEILLELNVDSLLYGEGDFSISELAERIENGYKWNNMKSLIYKENNKLIINESYDRIDNLDVLPFPERDNLKYILNRGGVAAVSTSRGCYGNCSFCLIQSNFAKQHGQKEWTGRSGENIIDEIESLFIKYGTNEIWFMDPNFIGPIGKGSERALEMCKEIKERDIKFTFTIECRTDDVIKNKELLKKLVEVGLRRVFLGIESGVQECLDLYNKGVTVKENKEAVEILRDLGVSMHAGFIYYDPTTTLEEIRENIDFIREIGTKDISFPGIGRNLLGLLHGTPITNLMKSNGITPNLLGTNYKLNPKVREIYLLMNKCLDRYAEIRLAERITWRDIYIMNNDYEGNEIVTRIKENINTFVLNVMEKIAKYFIINENYEVKDLLVYYEKVIKESDEKIKVLKELINIENDYRKSKGYFYDI
ncbi:B12-binding domain-containing radical SAM protein [Clostridium taeniosporum]|uniref:Radical SAM protein n=1 Tax=Clostridium taeniosporum TaxID=394958 RepID=A0A1D7XH08_9CLOT|nr:radical SAM protein [Clostridium taeniosporum]AOR22643.1 radical SAM protein [Clostridium taeniosporum]